MPAMVSVPDLTGRTEAEAKQLLAGANLVVGSIETNRTGAPAGTILSQSPSPGVVARSGTPVTLVISAAQPPAAQGSQTQAPAVAAPSRPKSAAQGSQKQAPQPVAPLQPVPVVPGNGTAARPSTSGFEETDAALAQLLAGTVAFSTPDRMQLGERRVLGLLISPTFSAAQLTVELKNRLRGSDEIRSETLQIAPQMEAHIRSSAFEIDPLTPTRQAVSKGAPTEWRWNITATESGKHTLHLAISAVIIVEGDRVPRLINVLDRVIAVEVTSWQRIQQFSAANWQFIVGTVLIPFGVWFWTRRQSSATPRKRAQRSDR